MKSKTILGADELMCLAAYLAGNEQARAESRTDGLMSMP